MADKAAAFSSPQLLAALSEVLAVAAVFAAAAWLASAIALAVTAEKRRPVRTAEAWHRVELLRDRLVEVLVDVLDDALEIQRACAGAEESCGVLLGVLRLLR